MKVIRHIHPIGQGAFYSEKIMEGDRNIANVVYDCGSELKQSISEKGEILINTVFKKKDVIDILFISHFDLDHVNGIVKLYERVKHIQYVVMPLLSSREKDYYITIYEAFDKTGNLIKIFKDTKTFFKNSHIIYINPSNDIGEATRNITFLENLDYNENNETYLDSYKVISLKTMGEWIYIPYNYQSNDVCEQFEDLLISKGFSQKNFLTGKISSKQVRDIYIEIEKDVNNTSLLVYSGPCVNNNQNRNFLCFNYLPINRVCGLTSGCLYTGDACFKKEKGKELIELTKTRLNPYIKELGIVQIPHHGSKHSYSSELVKINNNCNFYFLSYGDGNSYGHPHDSVIEDIIQNMKIVFCVNQYSSTSLTEYCYFLDKN